MTTTDSLSLGIRRGFASIQPRWILTETIQFLALLEELGIRLVNITAGSPYYNPHIQRPALYPPSDGYQPPEDPLVGVARQMEVTRQLKQQFPNMIFVGTGYSYLQDFLPHVAQAAVREGWVDLVGLGRMVLTYPEILWDASEGRTCSASEFAELSAIAPPLRERACPRVAIRWMSTTKILTMAEKLDIAKGIAPSKPQIV